MSPTPFWHTLVDEVVPIRHAADQSATYVRHILPDASPNLVWLWQEGLAAQDASQWVTLPVLSLGGLLTHKKDYRTSVQARGLIIKLRPWALGLLKGRSASESVDRTIGFTEVCPASNPALLTNGPLTMHSYAPWLEPVFARHFSLRPIDQLVIKAIQTIQQQQPGSRVKALAEQAARCSRQFERRFKNATGLTPKQFIRNVRFERAHNRLLLGHSLLDVTYDCGYFDQTHFTREFKAISGASPKQFQQSSMSHFY